MDNVQGRLGQIPVRPNGCRLSFWLAVEVLVLV